MALILRSSGTPLTNNQIDENFTYLRDNVGLTGDVVSTGNATTVNKINGVALSGLATGILRNTTTTGAPVIAIASDFPTLNQSTTGSAATLTTSRNINGVSFNGSADITIKATATNILTFGTNLTGTSYDGSSAVTIGISTAVALRADTTFIGTTSVALNRTSANLALTGISSVTLPGSTSGSVQLIPIAAVGTGTILTIPATTGTIVTTGDVGTVTNTMLAGSIANAKLTNSSLTVGTTAISLGASSTTLVGLTSVTSTGFTGALTGNASTATTLATARTINGVAFNGSQDITVVVPISTGVTGLATGIATFLATPTSANLATAVTDETGTGLLVFNTSPAISTSLTTASASFALLNTAATTVNFAGAATTLTMGASTGTSTVNNDLVVSGNLTVNGTTTTLNTSTLAVDDKNLELGSVPSATISATGTVGTITGTGPWAAIVTGMTTTIGLIVGSSLSATVGTGSLGGSGSYIITSIDSKTQVSYSATGGSTPVAGTITAITTTGYNNITANGAGITVKGTTDKTLNWVSSTTAWTSSENLDIASGKSYSIAGTSVLSSTTLGSGVTASSLTSVGTLVNPAYSGTLTGGTGIINIGSGQIYKDASGNVGIGTGSPSNKLHVSTSDGNGIYVEDNSSSFPSPTVRIRGWRSDTNGSQTFGGGLVLERKCDSAIANGNVLGTIYFGGNYDTTPNFGYAASISGRSDGAFTSSTNTPTALTFYTGVTPNLDTNTTQVASGTERMRIDSSGNVTLQNNISVGGAAPTTSGTGITFPAIQSASTNANTLDDYEEGTWTPVLTSGFTTTGTVTTSGFYTKIGKQVTVKFLIQATTVSPANNAVMSGLPFAGVYSVGAASTNGGGAVSMGLVSPSGTTLVFSGVSIAAANIIGSIVITV